MEQPETHEEEPAGEEPVAEPPNELPKDSETQLATEAEQHDSH